MNVFITGATAGIGKETARIFAKNGANLIITGRRKERLEELKKDFEKKYNISVLTLNFDIRDYEATKNAIEKNDIKDIDILVNNAGLSRGLQKLHEGKISDWEEMIDTNVKGLLYITKLLLPDMVKKGKGHIINIGSTAGHEAYPGGNVYCATKHAVHALSNALRIDLVDTPIRVSEISPGLVETEFSIVRFHGDKEKADNVYKGLEPLHPEDIAELVYFTATRPAHVQINEIIVTPTAQATATIIDRKK